MKKLGGSATLPPAELVKEEEGKDEGEQSLPRGTNVDPPAPPPTEESLATRFAVSVCLS